MPLPVVREPRFSRQTVAEISEEAGNTHLQDYFAAVGVIGFRFSNSASTVRSKVPQTAHCQRVALVSKYRGLGEENARTQIASQPESSSQIRRKTPEKRKVQIKHGQYDVDRMRESAATARDHESAKIVEGPHLVYSSRAEENQTYPSSHSLHKGTPASTWVNAMMR